MATFPFLLLLAAAATPAARARQVATNLPFAYRAYLEVRRQAGAIADPALRAAVEAQILGDGKHKKVIHFRKKKEGWTKKRGHRQPFTEVLITAVRA
jgi:ribosomal protein L21